MLKKLQSTHSQKIDYVMRVVNVYEFALSGESPPPDRLKVKILIDVDGNYTCAISQFVQRTGLAGSHSPGFGTYDSEEQALQASISHGLMNYDPTDSGAKWDRNKMF